MCNFLWYQFPSLSSEHHHPVCGTLSIHNQKIHAFSIREHRSKPIGDWTLHFLQILQIFYHIFLQLCFLVYLFWDHQYRWDEPRWNHLHKRKQTSIQMYWYWHCPTRKWPDYQSIRLNFGVGANFFPLKINYPFQIRIYFLKIKSARN